MEINILLENTTKDKNYETEHGLSAIISVHGKTILLDTGQSDNFLKNAEKMGIDISSVDFAVISHFHYDHSGGLKYFLEANESAKVYIGAQAFDEYYVDLGEMKYFGLSEDDFDMSRFIFVDDYIQVAEGVSIISKLGYTMDNPLNDKFYKLEEGEYVLDDFSHEIAIVIEEEGENTLISGCFHSGVVNSIKRANSLGYRIEKVLGGFHLASSSGNASEDYIDELVEFLRDNDIKCYTGHCTGEQYLKELQDRLDGNVFAIYSGAHHIL